MTTSPYAPTNRFVARRPIRSDSAAARVFRTYGPGFRWGRPENALYVSQLVTGRSDLLVAGSLLKCWGIILPEVAGAVDVAVALRTLAPGASARPGRAVTVTRCGLSRGQSLGLEPPFIRLPSGCLLIHRGEEHRSPWRSHEALCREPCVPQNPCGGIAQSRISPARRFPGPPAFCSGGLRSPTRVIVQRACPARWGRRAGRRCESCRRR